jgi:lantibiotic modifying enzyme
MHGRLGGRPCAEADIQITESWRPLLDGGLADRAAETVSGIAGSLCALPYLESGNASLPEGSAGIALFHAYHARSVPRRADPMRAQQRLDHAVAAIAETRLPPGLHSGFCGVAWAMEHVMAKSDTTDGGDDDVNLPIDEAVEASLRDGGLLRETDLISGLAGVGVYALERLPRPSGKRILELVVHRLSELGEQVPDGMTWSKPDGSYNLGVAHGIPGLVGFLGQACAAGVSEAYELLEGAVRWLLARRWPRGSAVEFSTSISVGAERPADRVSWCYGNPGIAVALLLAARAVGEKHWENEALDLALAAAARGTGDPKVVDASVCHGSAGNAHLFNRLFQATGDERFRDAATSWVAKTFELQKQGSGLAGFMTLRGNADNKTAWVKDPGLLSGIAGTGLALLAATTTVEPCWDRVILAAVRPKA